jgi:translation elongation factor EF-1alpha
MSFALFGHVDHGKSTCAGQLLLQTGNIDEHEFGKIRHAAENDGAHRQIYSRILDEYREEQERGKTCEFTYRDFAYKDHNYRLVDTPGHKAFIRSMIEGIYEGINIGVLVVSVLENEFRAGFVNGGQTKEHLLLARAVGIPNLIVCINKMDLVDWDQDRFNQIRDEVNTFLKKLSWKAHYVATSGYAGQGLVSYKDGVCPWNTGPLIDKLNCPDTTHVTQNISLLKSHNKYRVKLQFLQVPTVITAGFCCMMHFMGQETPVVIRKIQSNIPFIREPQLVTVFLETPQPITLRQDGRLVFRKNEETLGFGVLIHKS